MVRPGLLGEPPCRDAGEPDLDEQALGGVEEPLLGLGAARRGATRPGGTGYGFTSIVVFTGTPFASTSRTGEVFWT